MKNKLRIFEIFGLIAMFLAIGSIGAIDDMTISNTDVPIGAIIMYNGDINDFTYPEGYLINDSRFHICNGFNGTVDLRHSYVAGYDEEENSFDEIGETFGNNSYNLTVAQLPSHRHSFTDWYPGFRTQSILNGLSPWCESVATRNTFTGYTGSNYPIDNRPYTTVVNFIQRIA